VNSILKLSVPVHTSSFSKFFIYRIEQVAWSFVVAFSRTKKLVIILQLLKEKVPGTCKYINTSDINYARVLDSPVSCEFIGTFPYKVWDQKCDLHRSLKSPVVFADAVSIENA